MYSYLRSVACFSSKVYVLAADGSLKTIYFLREFGTFFSSFDSNVVFEVVRQISGNGMLLIRAIVIQHLSFYSAVNEPETRFASGMERDLSDLSRSIRHQEIFEPQPGNFG